MKINKAISLALLGCCSSVFAAHYQLVTLTSPVAGYANNGIVMISKHGQYFLEEFTSSNPYPNQTKILRFGPNSTTGEALPACGH